LIQFQNRIQASSFYLVAWLIVGTALPAMAADPVLLASQPLPMIKLPNKLAANDMRVLNELKRLSIVPVRKGVFPDYRPRAYDENNEPVSAWSVADYDSIKELGLHSEEFRQIVINQTGGLESKVGGINNHGVKSELIQRANVGYYPSSKIEINADCLDSWLAAVPVSWNEVLSKSRQARGSRPCQFDLASLNQTYGASKVASVLQTFAKLEKEKGRSREVWLFALPNEDWTEPLTGIKSSIRAIGYDAFAMETVVDRVFFASKKEADSFVSSKVSPLARPLVAQEGPAELVLDKHANIVKLNGKVEKVELSAAQKDSVEFWGRLYRIMSRIVKALGLDKDGILDRMSKIVGMRFKFANYPDNWIPPGAKIEKLAGGGIKITVPARYSVTTKVRQAFAVKGLDQWAYLRAQGLTGINYGLSGADIIAIFRSWDKQYGLSVLHADFDIVQTRLDRTPSDVAGFVKEEQRICPIVDTAAATAALNKGRLVDFWWD